MGGLLFVIAMLGQCSGGSCGVLTVQSITQQALPNIDKMYQKEIPTAQPVSGYRNKEYNAAMLQHLYGNKKPLMVVIGGPGCVACQRLKKITMPVLIADGIMAHFNVVEIDLIADSDIIDTMFPNAGPNDIIVPQTFLYYVRDGRNYERTVLGFHGPDDKIWDKFFGPHEQKSGTRFKLN